MANAFDAATNGGHATGTSLTFSHTCTGANLILFIGIFGDAGGDKVTGVTYNGVAMTLVKKILGGTGGSSRDCYVYLLVGPAVGAHNVVVSASSSITMGAVSASYSGAKQTGQPDAFSFEVGNSNSFEMGVTPVQANTWAVLFAKADGSFSMSLNTSAPYVGAQRAYDQTFGGEALYDSNGASDAGTLQTFNITLPLSYPLTWIVVTFAPSAIAQALTATPIVTTATLSLQRQKRLTLTATPIVTTATLATAKPPNVSAIVPSSDRTTGGATALIAGGNFQAGATVTFDGVAGAVTFISSVRLSVVVPAHAAGAVDVVVTNPDATTVTVVGGFTFYAPLADLTAPIADFGGATPTILRSSDDASTLSVTQSSAQGQASFSVESARPVPFTPIKFGIGSLADNDLIFHGKQQSTTQYALETDANQRWDGVTIDSSAEFNRLLVWGTYTSVPADQIAQDLLAKFGSDFTGAHIVVGLPAITIVYEGVTMDSAFNSLATAIGGYYYRDNSYDIHLFVTETPDLTPDALTSASSTLVKASLKWTANTSQVRDRVIGVGANTGLISQLDAGETIVPIKDGTLFDDAPNTVLIGAQRVSYQNRVLGGGMGSSVGPGVTPSVAPALSLAPGMGLGLGTFGYGYQWVTPAGHTLISPLAYITTGAIAAPSTAPSALAYADGIGYGMAGWAIGDTITIKFAYGIDNTHITAVGSASASYTLVQAPGRSVGFMQNVQLLGAYSSDLNVKVIMVYVSHNGGTYTRLFTPGGTLFNYPGGGNWVVTLFGGSSVTSDPVIAPLPELQQVLVDGIAVGPSPTTNRTTFRTTNGGAQPKLLTTLDNIVTSFTDAAPDSSLGVNAPIGDTSGLTQPTGQVLAGATEIPTASAGAFLATGGWTVDGIRYSGISGNSLIGIPESGAGAILVPISYGTRVLAADVLTGVLLTNNVPINALVSLYCQRDDVPTQVAIALIEGGRSTGIYEFKISDSTIFTQAALNARCDADLVMFSSVDGIIQATYDTFDRKSACGRPITGDGSVNGLVGSFVIQTVSISRIGQAANTPPRITCTISNVRWSMEDILRHMVLNP
jgi:hypothetical protein